MVAKHHNLENPSRLSQLAWFGGTALFFITLIIPIQFEKQWITLGWALEGAALCWLFRRVPHPGLRGAGAVLSGLAFVRLALNPAVLSYQISTGQPLWIGSFTPTVWRRRPCLRQPPRCPRRGICGGT